MEQNNSNTPVEPTKIFFGGAFNFDCRDEDYKIMAAEDYRAQILGSVDALIRPKDMNGMSINDNVLYIGPFYFEAEKLGFNTMIIPRNNLKGISTKDFKIKLVEASKVEEAFQYLFG